MRLKGIDYSMLSGRELFVRMITESEMSRKYRLSKIAGSRYVAGNKFSDTARIIEPEMVKNFGKVFNAKILVRRDIEPYFDGVEKDVNFIMSRYSYVDRNRYLYSAGWVSVTDDLPFEHLLDESLFEI